LSQFYRITLTALLGLWTLTLPALAQQAQPAKGEDEKKLQKGQIVEVQIPIAVIDVQKILIDALAVKNIRQQITKYGTSFEEEIEKDRKEIRTANQELARQRTILSPEAFAEKRRKFEQRVVEVQRLVQQRRRELDKSRNEAMMVVNKSYTEIVWKIANELNLAVILRKSQTAYAIPTLDITKEVLTRLDKKLPTVKVSNPGK
jgi:Skp family chaperone for outer membrane proteins|tara:strand:+ start:8785 stop:9393 length:609 start_codon:yes stop_codon:yes gene_type:complete